MTGNNKFWRASLAGLASVAMLATMGVTALTASAATPVDDYKVKFVRSTESSEYYTQQVKAGDSTLDALNAAIQAPEGSFTTPDGKVFVGYYGQDGKPFDFTAPVNGNTTITAKYVNASEAVKVTFDKASEYAYFPLGGPVAYLEKGAQLDAKQAPADKAADGRLATQWTVKQAGTEDVKTSTLAGIKVNRPADGTGAGAVTVAPTQYAPQVSTLRFYGNNGGNSSATAYALNWAADGGSTSYRNFEVDVPTGSEYQAPAVYSTDADVSYAGWKNQKTNALTADNGNKVTASSDADLNKYDVDTASKVTTVTVKFDSNGGSKVADQRVALTYKDASGTAFGYVTEPEAPTRDGYVFNGWYNGSQKIDFSAAVGTPGNPRVTANTTLTADWKATTATVKVTFKDAQYNGSQKSVTVEASGNAYLTADQVPSWTRDGYVLSGWTKADGSKYTAKDLTDNYLVSELNDGNDVTFTAAWTPVTINTVEAALAYINAEHPNTLSNHKTVDTLFTADSWKAFKDTYITVRKAYDQAKFNATESKLTDADASKLVSELAAAWQKLEFSHEGNALDKDDRSFAFRLYSSKLDEHFYSQAQDEIYGAALIGLGYKVEAPLFQTVPKAENDADTEAYGKLADFGTISNYVDSHGDSNAVTRESVNALREVADPVLTTVVRFYNRETGDHVWSTDPAEQKTLSADKAWNNEGAAFYVPSYTGKTPVTRLYNPATDRHLLSVDPAEQSNLTKNAGWTVDGVVFNGI